MNKVPEYTVKWGRILRTVVYQDSNGELLFTTDASNKGKQWIVLEHYSPRTPRETNYYIAFERIKQYLESCGYSVEIYGE